MSELFDKTPPYEVVFLFLLKVQSHVQINQLQRPLISGISAN